MVHPSRLLAFVVLSLLLSPSAAFAGGWAGVIEPSARSAAVAGEPWSVEVQVLQHGITPMDIDGVTAEAHLVGGDASVTATGTSTGETGVYRLTFTFPAAGTWAWSVTPGWMESSEMRSIDVVTAGGSDLSASIVEGDCHGMMTGSGSIPVRAMASSTVARWWISEPFALPPGASRSPSSVAVWDAAGSLLGCSELSPVNLTGGAIVPIDRMGEQPFSATLSIVNDVVVISAVEFQSQVPASTIRIVDSASGWTFEPSSVSISVGETVTWVNESSMAHTITGVSDPAFVSGFLAPGQSYSRTFTSAGAFAYACDPHPGMSGIVTVIAD